MCTTATETGVGRGLAITGGATQDDLLVAYPRLEVEDIAAALAHAAETDRPRNGASAC
jgi:uncharacterized protein (DUF433 family)